MLDRENGADEFARRLESVLDARGADDAFREAVRDRLRYYAWPTLSLDWREVFATFSIGSPLSVPGHDDPDSLLRTADLAMYRAKTTGRARCAVFDPSMSLRAIERLELEADLRHAIEHPKFRVVYSRS